MTGDILAGAGLLLVLAAFGLLNLVYDRRPDPRVTAAERARAETLPPGGPVYRDVPPGVVLGGVLDELHPPCRHTLSLVDVLPGGVSLEECTTCCRQFRVDGSGVHPAEEEGVW